MDIKIDMRKKLCPIPVIETRKEMKLDPLQTVITIVDNWTAVENLQKLGKQMGYENSVEEKSKKEYLVILSPVEEVVDTPIIGNNVIGQSGETVIVLSSELMGQGDAALGKMLLKGYLYAVTQLDTQPDYILLYNSGVYLSITGADTIDDLLFLQQNGTKILSCGACLGHYGLIEKLAVGEITNMYTIAEILSKAQRIIQP